MECILIRIQIAVRTLQLPSHSYCTEAYLHHPSSPLSLPMISIYFNDTENVNNIIRLDSRRKTELSIHRNMK